jgi:hypothetical protein
MADIVNLRQARKRKRRDAKDQQASENRAKFGRTKGEKQRDAIETDRARRQHDQAKLTPDDD